MKFFNIEISEYYITHMVLRVEWLDIKGTRSKEESVFDKEALIARTLSIEAIAIKGILRRFINQRQKALKIKFISNNNTPLKDQCSIGDVCKWAKTDKNALLALLPAEESRQASWRKIIPKLLDFCESYHPGDGRKEVICSLNSINPQ